MNLHSWKGKEQTSLISPFSFKLSSKVDRINWSLSVREGTASGPLSTTPRHICQIRGISATREPRIGEEREKRQGFTFKSRAISNALRKKTKKTHVYFSLWLFRNKSPGLNRKKQQLAECIVNQLHAINKTWDETRQWVRGNAWLLFWPHFLCPVACRLDSACAFARSKTCLCHWLWWTGEASLLIGMMWFSDEPRYKWFPLPPSSLFVNPPLVEQVKWNVKNTWKHTADLSAFRCR